MWNMPEFSENVWLIGRLWRIVLKPLIFYLWFSGNSLTIFVMLRKPFRHMSVSVVLISLSVSDTIVSLMLPFNKMFIRQLIGYDVRVVSVAGCRAFYSAFRLFKVSCSVEKGHGSIRFPQCEYVLWLLCALFTSSDNLQNRQMGLKCITVLCSRFAMSPFQMMSSWCVVLISIERFVAVWFPSKAKRINTKRNVLICITGLFISFATMIGYWTSFADHIIVKNGKR